MKRRDGVRLRGGVWYIRLPGGKSGLRLQERTTAKSRKEAVAIRNKRLVEMREGLFEPDAAKTRVADLVTDLKTDYDINGRDATVITRRWRHLEPTFGNDLAVAVTTSRLRAYVQSRLAEDARTDVRRRTKTQPATVQRELAMLRRAFQLGLEGRKVQRIPVFPTIEVNNTRTGFFERDEFDRVRAELPDNFSRPFVTLAYMLGFRRGELLNLEWRQVDLDKGTVRLDPGTTKNNQQVATRRAPPPHGGTGPPRSSVSTGASSLASFTATASRSTSSRTWRGIQPVSGQGAPADVYTTSAGPWHGTTSGRATTSRS